MDPTATLRDFLIACDEDEAQVAREAIASLAIWCATGGFLPDVRLAISRFHQTQDGEP